MKKTSVVLCVCLLLSFCAAAQEVGTEVKIDRRIGKVELGEYVSSSMISESFNLPDIYFNVKNGSKSTTFTIVTAIEWFGVKWPQVEVVREGTSYQVESVIFSKKTKKENLYPDYALLREYFCERYGKVEEDLSYGGTHLSSTWRDGNTVIDLVHIFYPGNNTEQYIYLSLSDLKNE